MDRETAVLLDWYRIRDTFLGENGIPRNVVKALKLASSCEHEDAQWLFHVCADGRVKSKEEAITAFELVEEFDARALCFGWVLRPDRYITRLRRSAELGYAFAQARLAEWKDGDERAKLANTAVRAGERLGFFVLGTCFRDGEGCERSSMKARENFLVAAELGDIVAMDEVGHLLENSDPRKWFLVGPRWRRSIVLVLESLFGSDCQIFFRGCKEWWCRFCNWEGVRYSHER